MYLKHVLSTLLTVSLAASAAPGARAQGASPSPCPAVGADTTCGVIITITDAGATPVATNQPPYDTIEDTLVGVVNNSSIPISSIALTSNLDIFGFDGDGICGLSPVTGLPYVPAPPPASNGATCPFGPTGYEGPGVSFSNYASLTSGTVTFNPPLPPKTGTAYFSLENALGVATACSTLINNALKTQVSGKNICAAFTPNQANGSPATAGMPGYTLAQAAQLCGFTNFDWVQKITTQFDPSEFYARNLGGAFDPTIPTYVRLTSKRVPWYDPPQGGGYAPNFGGEATPDNSYPFYYDPNVDLPDAEDGSDPVACTLPNLGAGITLTHHDAPADGCLPGGSDVGTTDCMDPILAPKAKSEPRGSFGGYMTRLAGVNANGTATDLGIGFTWTSTYNGKTGGAHIKKTSLAADGDGTGGITITSVNELTTYSGVTITGINGATPASPVALTSPNGCNGSYTGTFSGDIFIWPGQDCVFTSGYIAGSVIELGGNLSLSGVLVGGSLGIVGDSTFSIGPSTSINGDFLAVLDSAPRSNASPPPSQVCGANVSGSLLLEGVSVPVQIGAALQTSCLGNVIAGDLDVDFSSASFSIFGNTIGDNLQIDDNSGAIQVFNNSVKRDLDCEHDSSITGGTNQAQKKQGQCVKF